MSSEPLPPAEPKSILKLVLDAIPVRVFWKDRTLAFLGCNPLFAEDAGLTTPDEVIGKTDYDMPWKDQADLYRSDDRQVIETGTPRIGYEEPQTTPTGRTIWLRTSKIPLRDDEGRIIGVMGAYEDITERKQSEHALSESEEKYRDLVQTANSIILRWGPDGRVRFFNEFAQSFFGYTENEILGRSVIGMIVPETDSSGRDLVAMMADILAHPERHETKVNENMRKDGERVWVAWTNRAVLDEQGKAKEVLSVGLDITARKHAEDALQESEGRYRAIFNSNVDAFLLFDLNGVIIDANNRAADLYGYSRGELVGLSGKDIVDPRFHSVFEGFVSTAVGEWFVTESVDVRRDGARFDVLVHGTRLRYGGMERLLAIVFDVTERNKARESMRLFTDVVRNMQAGLYIYRLEDPHDSRTLRLTAANPASTTELGLREEDVVGRYIDEVFPGLREEGIAERFADVVRTGIPFSMDDFTYSDARLPPGHFSFRAFCVPGSQVGVLFEDITDMVHAEEEKRQFYRKTIESATEGKLIISDYGEIERAAGPAVVTDLITEGSDLHKFRAMVREIAESEGMDEDRMFDLLLCVGEATTNAIKHAQGGVASVHRRGDVLMILVSDRGPGIQAINLPDVALRRGYSTAISLGMGYKAMISIADHVYLATGPDGTTVGIEMRLHPVAGQTIGVTLPDTW